MSVSAAVASGRSAARPLRASWAALEAFLLVVLLGVALVLRLHDLEGPRSAFPDLFDEGIRAEQLLLMAHGFRPFRDIYSAQGLLLLDLLYPFYVLFGGTLGAIRLGVGVFSVVGLLGAWWSGRQVAGRVGGLCALLLLAASPVYLEESRLALAEVPSMAPCLWAIGCGVRWQRGRSARWLYGAAALGTLGVLIKPMAVAVAVPLGLLMLLRPGARPRHILTAAGVAIGITALVVLIMGPAEVRHQIVEYRVGAGRNAQYDFRRNFKEVLVESFRDQPGIFLLAAASALLLVAGNWRRGVALASWPLAVIGLLLAYSSLHPKHLVYLYPPITLLAGAGLGRAAWLARAEGPTGRSARYVTVALAAALALVPLGTGAAPAGEVDEDSDLHVFDEPARQSLQLLTGPSDFVLTDHPYVAAISHRMVPPALVDPSKGRARAGVLSSKDAIEAAAQFDVRLVLIWADRLRRLDGFPGWLESRYVLAQAFGTRNVKNSRGAKDRSVYLRRDSDLETARARLESGLTVRETVDFEGKIRLLGATVSTDRAAPQEQFTVTLGWLALSPMTSDYHVTLQFVDPNGELRHEQEHDLEGGARGTSTWQPGRWLFRSFTIQPEASSPAGEYRVVMAVVDPKSGTPLRPAPAASTGRFVPGLGQSLTLATIQVE